MSLVRDLQSPQYSWVEYTVLNCTYYQHILVEVDKLILLTLNLSQHMYEEVLFT